MASYYYLLSGLPMLRADGEMPMTYRAFLDACRSNVSESEYATLEGLTLSSSQGPFLSEWAEFYTALRQELSAARNQRLGRPAQSPGLREEAVTKAVASAMKEKNPLTAEQLLLTLEFKKLDELIGLHNFDHAALMGYALKLRLLERKSVFDAANGKAELDRIVAELEQQIMSMEQE